MANDLTANPLILDTAPTVISTTRVFRIRRIRLVSGSDASAAVLEDGAGRQVFSLKCSAAGVADDIDFHGTPFVTTGLELASISGTGPVVYVYCES